MKLHDSKAAPSARRVRMYLAEKGIDVETVEVDLRAGAQMSEDFRRINPECQVPCLELDDGTTIAETIAICRYFEALTPEPPMFGVTPLEQAVTEMWARYVELNGWLALVEFIRNGHEMFAGRSLPGPEPYEQIPALAERARKRWPQFLGTLDARLSDHPYVAGAAFTNTDITAFLTIEAGAMFGLETPAERYGHIDRWRRSVASRPSADA